MPEKLVQFIPFVFLSVLEGRPKLNIARIIEAIIMAAVGGLLSGYIAVQQMKIEINGMKADMAKIEAKVNTIDNRFFEHMTKK